MRPKFTLMSSGNDYNTYLLGLLDRQIILHTEEYKERGAEIHGAAEG